MANLQFHGLLLSVDIAVANFKLIRRNKTFVANENIWASVRNCTHLRNIYKVYYLVQGRNRVHHKPGHKNIPKNCMIDEVAGIIKGCSRLTLAYEFIFPMIPNIT